MKLFFRLLIATLCLILSFGIIEAKIQHPASAQVSPPIVKNGSFDDIGSNGSPVTTVGQSNGYQESAAAFWGHGAVVPDSLVTTELIPSTDPLPGGGGNMLHFTTNDGYYPPAQQGNGFAQNFPTSLPNGAVAEFDLLVVKGQVTAGLGLSTGPFANYQTFGSTDKWIHVTDVANASVVLIAFETLTDNAGSEYYVDNLQVHQFCN